MIRTADRKGNVVEEDSFQNNLLEKIYGSASGRALLRPLVTPPVSIAVGKLLDSGISAAAVKPFIWMNHLDMGDYEEQKYTSYNEFFKRKIREGARSIDMKPKHFISRATAVQVFILSTERQDFPSNIPGIQWRNFLRTFPGKKISGWLCVGASSLRPGLPQIYLPGQCQRVQACEDTGNPSYRESGCQ